MLQQAYLARKVSEDAFLSYDQELSQYQEENPHSTTYLLWLSDEITSSDIKAIALHFSDAGYDISGVVVGNNLIIDWKFAEEGRTGKINLASDTLTFIKQASYQENED